MVYLPVKTVHRCMKEDGAHRVSDDASEELAIFLRHLIREITRSSMEAASLSNRTTIQTKDIKFAIRHLGMGY